MSDSAFPSGPIDDLTFAISAADYLTLSPAHADARCLREFFAKSPKLDLSGGQYRYVARNSWMLYVCNHVLLVDIPRPGKVVVKEIRPGYLTSRREVLGRAEAMPLK